MVAPVHAPIRRSDLVSNDVNIALTMFAETLLEQFHGFQDPQVVQLGLQEISGALNFKYPISVGSAAVSQLINGIKYRAVAELMLPIFSDIFADGVHAEVRKLQSDAWTGWGMQPREMAMAARILPERLLATAVEAGEATASVENYVDGDTSSSAIKFFAKNKPVDPLGNSSATYDNLFTGAASGAYPGALPLNLANIDKVWQLSQTIKSQNGVDYRPLEWKWVLVSKSQELLARRLFEDQGNANDYVRDTSGTSTAELMVANTAKKHKIQVIASPYLTVTDTWYPIFATPTLEKAPWVTLVQTPANAVPFAGAIPGSPDGSTDPGFEWIIDDLTSEMYKRGIPGGVPAGHVAIAAKRIVGVALTAPWQMFKCKAA